MGWTRSLVAAVSLAAFVGACAGPPKPPSRRIRFESEVHSVVLRNGIRALVVEDHSTNLVEVGVRFAVGSSSDPKGKAGLAHLVEHLMFQVRADKRPVAADIAAVAIGFNAYTSWDSTHYMTTARGDQLDRVLALEGVRFTSGCATISKATFEREREVVRNELRLRRGSLPTLIDFVLGQVYAKGHAYHRNTIGDDHQLSAMTLQDACDFMDALYRPDRMTVVISGNVRWRAAAASIAKHLGVMKGRSRGPKPNYSIPALGGRTVRHETTLGGRLIVVAWPMPPEHSDAYIRATVALRLLAKNLGRSKNRLALPMELGGPRAPVALLLMLLDERTTPREAIDAVWRAAKETAKHPGGRDLEHFLNVHARLLLTRYDALRSRVIGLSDTLQFAPNRHLFAHRLTTIDKLEPKRVAAAAKSVLSRDKALVVIAEPSDETGRELEQSSLSYRGRSHDGDEWKAPVDPAQAVRALKLPVPPSLIESSEQLELENGLRVMMLRTPAAPVMSAHLVFAGGTADEPSDKPGLARFAAHQLHYGVFATKRDQTHVADALYLFGDRVDVDVASDYTVFSVHGLSSHMDAMLAGISGLVVDGRYRRAGLELLRKLSKRSKGKKQTKTKRQKEQERLGKARKKFFTALYRHVYGPKHPYARVMDLGWPSTAHIRIEDLAAHRKRFFTAKNGVLVITGQFDRKLTKQHVKYWFKALSRGKRHEPVRPAPARRTKRVVVAVASKKTDATTTIQIAYPLRHDERSTTARLVLARVVDQRVSRVRHRLGAAYAVQTRYVQNIGPGMLLVTAIVDAKRADESLAAIMAELRAIRADNADLSEDFVRARRQALKRVLADESGAHETGARIVRLVSSGRDLGHYTRLARSIMALTVADLRPLIKRDLAVEREYVGLYGPQKSIDAARSVAGTGTRAGSPTTGTRRQQVRGPQ